MAHSHFQISYATAIGRNMQFISPFPPKKTIKMKMQFASGVRHLNLHFFFDAPILECVNCTKRVSCRFRFEILFPIEILIYLSEQFAIARAHPRLASHKFKRFSSNLRFPFCPALSLADAYTVHEQPSLHRWWCQDQRIVARRSQSCSWQWPWHFTQQKDSEKKYSSNGQRVRLRVLWRKMQFN